MLSEENNERLTRVGPGTPMGRLMREYWIPAMLSQELPGPDTGPVRVMLLGERLIAFRDSTGRVGLLEEACPHRRASLFFGRNADCGLRCSYHGWKFDVNGTCLEIPSEGSEGAFAGKVRAKSYPCRERGGVVWTYMGERAVPPELPALFGGSTEYRAQACLLECNWLQALEGDVDLPHLLPLHWDQLPFDTFVPPSAPSTGGGPGAVRTMPAFPPIELEDTPVGFAYAYKPQDEWMIGQFMFPFYANLPQADLGMHWVTARVPMDDVHTMTIGMYAPTAPPASDVAMFGPELFLPNTTDWFGRFRTARNPSNDFGLDRKRQRMLRASGIVGQAIQDNAMTWGMGAIVDRSKERLTKSDAAIIRLRHRLLAALDEMPTKGAPSVDAPTAFKGLHGKVRVEGGSWRDELRKRGSFDP